MQLTNRDPSDSWGNMKSLAETIDSFMALVVQSSEVELAWLSTLSDLEKIACEHILGSMTARTPERLKIEIRSHAMDEARHAKLFLQIRENCRKQLRIAPGADFPLLEKRMREIGGSFMLGYFGNPLLTTANNRHTAYVHGSLTIEQFPFQIYPSYLRHTKMKPVRRDLPKILAEERAHLSLGKKMLREIPSIHRLSILELQRIEKDMLKKTIERLFRLVAAHLDHREEAPLFSETPARRLAVNAGTDKRVRIAWIYALGHAEKFAADAMQGVFRRFNEPPPLTFGEHVKDEVVHCQLLQRSVLLNRRRLRADLYYRTLESGFIKILESYLKRLFSFVVRKFKSATSIYSHGAIALERRVFRHYRDILFTMEDMGVAHILGQILKEEAQHLKMVQSLAQSKRLENEEMFQSVLAFEEIIFDEAATRAMALIQADREMRDLKDLAIQSLIATFA